MKIESIIRREASTAIKMPSGKTYTFGPTANDDRHTCEVEDNDDLGRFLAIREGFRIAGGTVEPPMSQATLGPSGDAFTAAPTPAPSAAPGSTTPPASPGSPTAAPAATEAPAPMPADDHSGDGAPATAAELDVLTKAQLVDFAKQNNIEVDETLPKPAILSKIKMALGLA